MRRPTRCRGGKPLGTLNEDATHSRLTSADPLRAASLLRTFSSVVSHRGSAGAFFSTGGGCTPSRRGKREVRVDVRREFPAVASSLADIRETTASSARETAASDTVV